MMIHNLILVHREMGFFFCLGPWKAGMLLQQKLEDDCTCMIRMLIPVKCEVTVKKKKSMQL